MTAQIQESSFSLIQKMIAENYNIKEMQLQAKKSSNLTPKPELVVFRLKRCQTDKQIEFILLQDRPNKKMRFNSEPMKKLGNLFSHLTLDKQIAVENKPEEEPEEEPKFQQKFLKRISTQELFKKDNPFVHLAEKKMEQRRAILRKQLLSALRGGWYDPNMVQVCEIDKGKFMIISGEEVPFKNIVGNDYEEDLYVLEKKQIKEDHQYPVMQCPIQIDSEAEIQSDHQNIRLDSPVDSQDSNAQDHADNDYPDEQDQQCRLSAEQDQEGYAYHDKRYNNDSSSDGEETIGFEEDFYRRYIDKRNRQPKPKRKFDNDDDEDDEDAYY